MQSPSHRVLLTSVVRPFGGPGEGASVGAELFHAQVTRAQGAFSLRQVIRVWGLDLIAENIDAPTAVLHYPSIGELEAELRRYAYTHIGINFVVATFHKVRQMVDVVRRVSPNTRIILGGYGTVLPDEVLHAYGDDICREEGVAFMRKLLGEDPHRPIRNAYSPVPSARILGYQVPTIVGHVTAGLGCANGCDFCCTSHFFKRKYVRLRKSGTEIYEALIDARRRAERDGHTMGSFALIDEDFFLQKKRGEEFLEAVRRGGEPLSIFGFGSVKGLSQFTGAEISEMGFDLVWTAFEGKQAGYAKLNGRPIKELHADLRAHGVGLLTSMILGFPYQDEATVLSEFEDLMQLEPAMAQFLIYFAFPGTPLFEQVVAEKRFLPQDATNPDLRRWDGFAMHRKHPHFSAPQLEALQRKLYDQDFRRLGPSIHRLADVWLRGAERFAGSSSRSLRARSEELRKNARAVMPTFAAAKVLLPSREARLRAVQLEKRLIDATGKPSLAERLKTPLAVLSGAVAQATSRLGLFQQPGLLRVTHRIPEEAAVNEDTMRLHGHGTSLVGQLLEDIDHLVLDRFRADAPTSSSPVDKWRSIQSTRGSMVTGQRLLHRHLTPMPVDAYEVSAAE